MKRLHTSARVIVLLMLTTVFPLLAQQGGFDVQAYSDFLSQNADMSGSALLAAHPAPLLTDGIAGDVSQAEWLDSISIKYGLTIDERWLLGKNGFVVSERLKRQTFQGAFSDVWMKDLPVFISTDAILHALHMSYDAVLKQIETDRLAGDLTDVITELWRAQAALEVKYGAMPGMQNSLRDVDLYLSVACNLMLGNATTHYAETAAPMQDIMSKISQEGPATILLFSNHDRQYDFSQFTVRGHYKDSPLLGRYFKMMMWLGRSEFMLTAPVQHGGSQQDAADIQRQVIDAALLVEALESTGAGARLRTVDALLTRIVGESDNVTPTQLRDVFYAAGVGWASDLLDTARVSVFQGVLADRPELRQRINSQILCSDPMSPEQIAPPTAFLLLGQRFVIDSYVLGNVVYDRIMNKGAKVPRLKPSVMDVLFATGNNAAAQLLQDELTQYPYAPNLNALRYLVDSYGTDFWSASIYNGWLDAIRTLDIPDEVDDLPAFMQTAAWWQEKMNTQLASWAQLRHDNLLYAKPSYTSGAMCSYPDAYVEPIPSFYRRMNELATDAASAFGDEGLDLPEGFFTQFAAIMDTLEIIATKELSHAALTPAETAFMKAVMFLRFGCTTDPDGWYTNLFYDKYWMLMERGDPTVGETVNIVTADVHTTPTDMGGAPVGWVKHVGTGYPNLGVFVVQRDIHNATAYVGPVMSFYEHTTEHFERLNDAQWKQAIDAGSYPRPDWVNVYLADSDGKRLPIGPSLATGTPARREPLLTCTASAPGITAIPREQRYDPMPFPVTATVKNIGNALSDSVFVSILLPPELSLAGVDAPDKSSKLLQPAQLFPNASGSVQWLIAHPLTKEEKCYTVQVSTVAANAPASTCEVEVVIPAMRYPHLAIGPHSVPNALIFVDSLDQYVPNPFPIRFSCMNQGNDIARNVSGTLDLPEHMEFDPPTQSATQYFTPTDMQPWKTGDSIPELLWTVRWNTRLRIDEKAEVRFVVSGEDAEGHALDSTDHRSLISIPGLQPELSCDMEIPDSLSLRSDGTGVEPNPFTVRYIVRNNSHQTGKVRQVVLYFPANEGLRLSPSSPNPMSFRSDWILHPGEEVTYEWFVDVDNRLTRRNIQVQIIGYDDEGNSLPCDDWLPIAALGAGSISATTTTSASVLHYDQASDSYSPSTFTYTGRLRTSGYMTLQDIEARMYWEDPSGLDLIEPDPSVADTTNPKTWSELGTNEEAEFTWGFRLKNRNTSGIPQYLHFFIDFTATNLPRHTVDSSGGFVEVEPVYTLGVDHPAATDLFTLHANHPNPFSGHSTISFELTRRAHVRLTVHNMLGEVVAVLVDDASEPGHHSCVFLPAGLPPGMYLYRLQAGGMLRSRTMLLLE